MVNSNVPSVLSPSPGDLMAAVHRDADLRESDGGCDPERPQSQRPRLVWSRSADGLSGGLSHHVPAG